MQRGLRNTVAAIRRFRMIMINLVDRSLIAGVKRGEALHARAVVRHALSISN